MTSEESSASVPAVPLKVGVVSPEEAGTAPSDTFGAVTSAEVIVKVSGAL